MRLRTCLFVALSLIASCRPKHSEEKQGESSNAASTGDPRKRGGAGACTVTLSGALSGTWQCGAQDSPDFGPLVTYDADKDETSVALAFNASDDAPDFMSGVTFKGKPVVGTAYAFSSAKLTGQAMAHGGGKMWQADSAAAKGAITLTFTEVSGPMLAITRTSWQTVHGTLDATLQSPSHGTVTVHSPF